LHETTNTTSGFMTAVNLHNCLAV